MESFAEIVDNQIKINEDLLTNTFNFIGDGIFDISFDFKKNYVYIDFLLKDDEDIKFDYSYEIENILNPLIANQDETGLIDYDINERLKLKFSKKYEMDVL